MKSVLKSHSIFALPLLLSLLCCGEIKNQKDCIDAGKTWYNNQCWEDFDDQTIIASEIDSFVTTQVNVMKKSKVTINKNVYPLTTVMPIEDEGSIIAVYSEGESYNTLLLSEAAQEIEQGKVVGFKCVLLQGDIFTNQTNEDNIIAKGKAKVTITDVDNFVFDINATIATKDSSEVLKISFLTNEASGGMGTSRLVIKNTEAYLSGALGTATYSQIKDLVENYPHIKTLILTHIPGSVNDDVNMHTGRLIRSNGLTTKVLSTSDIASGGVDLFCAGKERIVEAGALVGVHSWCCINDKTAIEISKKHPAHMYQIAYFQEMLGEKRGNDFYFYTLEAAPFDGIHNMTLAEIENWGVATKIIANEQ